MRFSEFISEEQKYTVDTAIINFGDLMAKKPGVSEMIKDLALENKWSSQEYRAIKELTTNDVFARGVSDQELFNRFTLSENAAMVFCYAQDGVFKFLKISPDQDFYPAIVLRVNNKNYLLNFFLNKVEELGDKQIDNVLKNYRATIHGAGKRGVKYPVSAWFIYK